MRQPKGFSSSEGEHLVCKLNKSIYGLKQASHQWYLKFHEIIASFSFEENIMDQCIYQKVSGNKICFLCYMWMIFCLQPMIRVCYMR